MGVTAKNIPPSVAMVAPHAAPFEQVLEELESHPLLGLDEIQVAQRQREFGRNEIKSSPRPSWWKRMTTQFKDLVVWILIGATVISGLLGDWLDMLVILGVVLFNALLSFLQEERAEKAITSLQKLSPPQAKVIRDGRLQTVSAAELVPGDLVKLEAGDRVPADARLVHNAAFRVQESALTGESFAVDKDHQAVLDETMPLADRVNMVHMSTMAASGRATAVVVATGMRTEIGRIAGLLRQQRPETTPLQRRLAELGRTLIFIVLGIVAVIFALHLLRGGSLLHVFLVSVSLAVAAVPEGLPAVVTIALAIGLQRMARRNALIRRLPSVETLGAVTVICTDKTGTLTRNEMTVREALAGDRRFDVTGLGYAPQGQFVPANASVPEAKFVPSETADLSRLLTIAAWCNHARLIRTGESDLSGWSVIGDPTEGALIVAALKGSIDVTPAQRSEGITHEIPFDSDRKMMSVVVRHESGSFIMYTKGAAEVILGNCAFEQRDGRCYPLDHVRRNEILHTAGEMAARAMRVLGLAFRAPVAERDCDETALVFSGLMGMMDPPRDEAKVAVQRCKSAGIRPVMITGDHPATAKAIAVTLGIASPEDEVLSGAELDTLSDSELAKRVPQTPVYARVSAEHKLRVIASWRSHGQIVAMTGDGVNDAPAVKAADIGIAMGITGTDVTKEASDMILTDDNFASIVHAVEEGRTIFGNIRKFVHYLLATNAGEVIFMFFAALVGWPIPLYPIQLLWINLVTDALPALALGMEPSEPDVMSRPPRRPAEHVIGRSRGLMILIHGTLIASVTATAFFAVYRGDDGNLAQARTTAFLTIAYAQLLFSFGCRSQRYTMPQLGFFSNRWLIGAIAISATLQLAVGTIPLLNPLFKTSPDLTWEWLLIVILALTPVTIIEVAKLACRPFPVLQFYHDRPIPPVFPG